MFWSGSSWHFFHIVSTWKSSLKDLIYKPIYNKTIALAKQKSKPEGKKKKAKEEEKKPKKKKEARKNQTHLGRGEPQVARALLLRAREAYLGRATQAVTAKLARPRLCKAGGLGCASSFFLSLIWSDLVWSGRASSFSLSLWSSLIWSLSLWFDPFSLSLSLSNLVRRGCA